MRRLLHSFVLGISLTLPVVGLTTGSASAADRIVREIVVEGTQRIEPDTVRSYMLIKEGDVWDARRVNRSLKSLFATGMFADVTLQPQGDKIVVNVVENPVINRIAFEGNRKIEDEELETEVSLRPRVIYARSKVQSDVNRVLTVYRRHGRFAATVEPKIIQLPQNRIDLVFEINEGDPTEIASIRFVGNQTFGDSRLREVIRTKESAWYRFFSRDDVYDPDRLTLDRELLRRFYINNGFADFRVISGVAELAPDRKHFFVTFSVDEGPRYEFGKVTVEPRLKGLEVADVEDEVDIETGDWYDSEAVEDTVERISNAANEQGHAFVNVRPRVDRDREAKTIDVAFEVAEGARVFVERIEIAGNVRTMDRVIRREFRLVEGDAFNAAKMRRSRQRIQNLDYFEKVDFEQLPGSAPDKTVLRVGVTEKSTGSLSLGAGFSTDSGVMGDVGIRERNLMGRGQDLKLNVVLASKRSQVNVGFTEPYFLGREIAAGIDIFHSASDLQDTSSYDVDTTGGALRAGYPITEFLSQNWKYTARMDDIKNVDDDASPLIQADEGDRILSEVSHTLTYDRRDSRIAPTEGYVLRMTNDLAGLGGDARYVRNTFEAGKYYQIRDQWILSFTGTAGHITELGEDLKVSDRFFVGGDDLRGFATAGVGPRDGDTDDALGGEWMYSGSAELQFPIGLPNEFGITGKFFTDIGSSGKMSPSNSDTKDTGAVRLSIGTGVTWRSPFGPIGVDLGFPIMKESFDVTETLRINFGTRF